MRPVVLVFVPRKRNELSPSNHAPWSHDVLWSKELDKKLWNSVAIYPLNNVNCTFYCLQLLIVPTPTLFHKGKLLQSA